MGQKKRKKGQILNLTSPDVELKEFWRDNERFSDLFNTVLFNGQTVLDSDLLVEEDTEVSGIVAYDAMRQSIVRTRDIVKKSIGEQEYLILGIENQMKVDYTMPLRVMVSDALGYLKQCKKITRRNKENKKRKRTSEEFLSGMNKDDRLNPIITIVIYYGTDNPWDGPLNLSDMMGDMSPLIKKVFSDYQMNLLQIVHGKSYEFSNSDLQIVFDKIREISNGDVEQAFT